MHHATVEFEDVSFTYSSGQEALRHITLQIEHGQRVALLGPNGAGKSTLLLHLNGLLRPRSGRVRICGIEVCESNLHAVRSAVGLLFQDPNDQLFCSTVFEDVAFGLLYRGVSEVEVRERVAEALASVGMAHLADRSTYHLSLGEKKRIALATVLVLQPEILALDEPSAGLDPRARSNFIRLLRYIHPTLLIATHDLHLARILCNRIIILHEGQIVADGSISLLEDRSLLVEYGLEVDFELEHAMP